jgi:hypothetical protein
MLSAVAIAKLLFGRLARRGDRVQVDTGRFECLDVGKTIDNPARDFQKPRPSALPPPLFENAGRNQPTFREAFLVEVLHCSPPRHATEAA